MQNYNTDSRGQGIPDTVLIVSWKCKAYLMLSLKSYVLCIEPHIRDFMLKNTNDTI